MRKVTGSGVAVGVASLAGSFGMPIAFPHAPHWIGVSLLIVSGVGFLFAFLWHWRFHGAESGAANTATTAGDGSPALSGQFRDVIINPPPAERRESQPPPPSEPIAASPAPAPDAASPAPAPEPEPEPEPDTPLSPVVLVKVYKKLGGAPDKGTAGRTEFYRRVDCEIMDKVKHRKMHVWARFGKRALKLIEDYEWEHGSFDHLKNELRVPVAYNEPYALTDMHFVRSEVDRVWPPAPALAGRSLTHEQQLALIAELSPLSPDIRSSQVSFTDSDSETNQYYQRFFAVFTRAGLKPTTGVDIPRNPEEVGVMVIADKSTAKEPTLRLLRALRSAGIEARLIEREEDHGIDLRLYIGPQPL